MATRMGCTPTELGDQFTAAQPAMMPESVLDLTDEKTHRVLHRIGVLLDEMAAVALAHHACRLRRFGRLASAPHQFQAEHRRRPRTIASAIACP
jgi:hypothetical protein